MILILIILLLCISSAIAGYIVYMRKTLFSSFTFTTAGASGNNGATLEQMNVVYKIVEKFAPKVLYNNLPGYQLWIVPETGKYTIEARGASGGDQTYYNKKGGAGASIKNTFDLTKGQELIIVVGNRGGDNGLGNQSAGGGGGSFIIDSANTTYPLIAAGGGGGAGIKTDGASATIVSPVASIQESGPAFVGGAGYNVDAYGNIAGTVKAKSFGTGFTGATGPGSKGGFGGGGSGEGPSGAGGGGGGYSGGTVRTTEGGKAGTSYSYLPDYTTDTNMGDGSVIITRVPGLLW